MAFRNNFIIASLILAIITNKSFVPLCLGSNYDFILKDSWLLQKLDAFYVRIQEIVFIATELAQETQLKPDN